VKTALVTKAIGVSCAAYSADNLYLQMRDTLDVIYAHASPSACRIAKSPIRALLPSHI